MNQESAAGMAEPLMNAVVKFNAKLVEATQDINDWYSEAISSTLADYKTLLGQLEDASTPQQFASIGTDHLRAGLSRSVKTWNDMCDVVSKTQGTLMTSMPVSLVNDSGKRKTDKPAVALFEPVAETFRQFTTLAQTMFGAGNGADGGNGHGRGRDDGEDVMASHDAAGSSSRSTGRRAGRAAARA